MRDTGDKRTVVLLYANASEDGIVFRKELDEIAKGGVPPLKVVHVLSRPEKDWIGEKGHVDREKIERYVGENIQGKVFYICGPVEMQKDIIATLRDLGVADKHIRQEIFSFLD
jgi:NAD(P)H-flavin reductase